MTILFVEGLTVMDFSYLHAERGLLGESWILDVMLHGTLDDQGMVLDFSDVKKAVKRLVDERYDHKLIVPIESDCTRIDGDPEQPVVTFTYGSHGETLVHTSPPSALCLLDAMAVSTDSVAKAIEADLMDIMPSNVEKIEIGLHEEPIEGAFYHYSHGLRQHCGNCQRIAHGHRSRIEIYRNGHRDLLLEEQWAERWRDIYIGSRDDLVEARQPRRSHGEEQADPEGGEHEADDNDNSSEHEAWGELCRLRCKRNGSLRLDAIR